MRISSHVAQTVIIVNICIMHNSGKSLWSTPVQGYSLNLKVLRSALKRGTTSVC